LSRRRQVRVSPSFFDRLDELLPAERSASGAPSTADLLLHEIPPLIEVLAVDYDTTTLAVEGVPGVRVLIAAGVLVPTWRSNTVVASDGSIEVIYLEIDELV
jgi:hypothetical protein